MSPPQRRERTLSGRAPHGEGVVHAQPLPRDDGVEMIDGRWRRYLAAFHDDKPGVTEELLRGCVTAEMACLCGGLEGCRCAEALSPVSLREDVVRVARNPGSSVSLAQVARDFGIHEMTLQKWLRKADVDEGVKPGVTSEQARELRDLKRRNRLLEQENEVLRRAAAYLSQSNLPGKCLFYAWCQAAATVACSCRNTARQT